MSTSTPTFISEWEAQITVTVAGVTFPAIKSWATFEGGDPVASTQQLFPGGGPGVATPGPELRSPITVTTPYTLALDAIRSTIDSATNNVMSVSYTPTDANRNPNGETTTYTGLLKQPQFPKGDAKSSANGFLGLVMECNS